MIDQNKTLFSIKATYVALILANITSAFFALTYFLQPTDFLIDTIGTSTTFLFFLSILIYFHLNPEKNQINALKYHAFVTCYAFIVPSWFFTIGSYTNNWVFVDVFPPITGLTLIVASIIMIMAPASWGRYVIAGWFLMCTPILMYLISHPLELNTPRGRELFVFIGPGGSLFFIVMAYHRGISERFMLIENHLQDSQKIANTDLLTNILNRRGATLWLEKSATQHSVFSGLLIDIDHFKNINDTHGHELGDNVLCLVSSVLQANTPEDACLARWGGDEFIIIIKINSQKTVETVAHNCLTNLNETIFPKVSRITCSIGGAVDIRSGNIDVIVRAADKALYVAKANGRNQASFTSA